jgi:uncharacterized membrane protein
MARSKRPPRIAPPLPIRIARLHAKLAFAVLVGVAVAGLLTLTALPWTASVLLGWDVGIAIYLTLTYVMMWRANVAQILRRAAEQDEGAVFILLLSIVATFASLVAIAFALGNAQEQTQSPPTLAVVMAVITILLSWFFVHTIFSMHYAHEYYGTGGDGKIGGLEFPKDDKPDYRDFLYFSLIIGMTSQVSDVAISSKAIRRIGAIHGVLSFFFKLVVLALTVNLVSNVIKPGKAMTAIIQTLLFMQAVRCCSCWRCWPASP